MSNYIAARKLYWTADKKRVIPQGAEAGYLFRAAGQVLTQKEVDQYGLAGTDMVKEVNASQPQPQNKAVLDNPPAATKKSK
jgi:hypothetical protein